MNTQSIVLDLNKKFSASQTVYVGRGDRSGTTVQATVTEAGRPVSLGGIDVSLRLPLGDVACTTSGSVATATLGESLVPDGTSHACLVLDAGEHIYSTERFRIVTLEGSDE